ncbi:hypothetical protein ACHAXH_007316 [Discostella pseudostelligera]
MERDVWIIACGDGIGIIVPGTIWFLAEVNLRTDLIKAGNSNTTTDSATKPSNTSSPFWSTS